MNQASTDFMRPRQDPLMKAVSNPLAPLPPVDQHSTFVTVKAYYMTPTASGAFDWTRPEARVQFTTENVAGICSVLTAFSRYLLSAYGALFVENEKGVGRITAVSEVGIRIVYFAGEYAGNSEWIHAADFCGNMNASQRTFKEQPVTYLNKGKANETNRS